MSFKQLTTLSAPAYLRISGPADFFPINIVATTTPDPQAETRTVELNDQLICESSLSPIGAGNSGTIVVILVGLLILMTIAVIVLTMKWRRCRHQFYNKLTR